MSLSIASGKNKREAGDADRLNGSEAMESRAAGGSGGRSSRDPVDAGWLALVTRAETLGH